VGKRYIRTIAFTAQGVRAWVERPPNGMWPYFAASLKHSRGALQNKISGLSLGDFDLFEKRKKPRK
jgi:hypothetical protein